MAEARVVEEQYSSGGVFFQVLCDHGSHMSTIYVNSGHHYCCREKAEAEARRHDERCHSPIEPDYEQIVMERREDRKPWYANHKYWEGER